MKVQIVHYNPQEPGQAGGAESAIRDQKRALELLGHEVLTSFANPGHDYRAFQPDIIHFHTVHVQLGLRVLLWAQECHIPHCLSLHDYWQFCSGRMLLAHGDQSCSAVTGLCNARCDSGRPNAEVVPLVNRSCPITFNEHSAAIMRRHGVNVAAVIPHGIDTAFFVPDYGQRGPEPQIITVSAWPQYPTKGMHILRAALRKIKCNAKLVSGVPREQVRDELQKADIFVFPSCYEESWGLCLTEAMACGLACVASNVCGPRAQIEHGKNGLLFENRDADELAVHLAYLLDDKEARERLGRNARAWAEEHANLERMGRDYVAFYQRVIDGAFNE